MPFGEIEHVVRNAFPQTLSHEESGVEQRFATFVAGHRDQARRMAWRLVGGDHDAADDVTQEAFLKAFSGLETFRNEAALETWFYRILVRQARMYRRWRRVRELWGGLSGEDSKESEAAPSRDPDLARSIRTALLRLTDAQREAFVLVQLEGFPVDEAARLTGKAAGTLKSHLQRARVALREDLADFATEKGTVR